MRICPIRDDGTQVAQPLRTLSYLENIKNTNLRGQGSCVCMKISLQVEWGSSSTSACLSDPSWGMGLSGQLMLHEQSNLSAWEMLVGSVHERGALISLQMSPPTIIGGRQVGPSEHRPGVHALSVAEIDGIIAAYARTAVLARRVGMDAVQIHGGHGYGLSRVFVTLPSTIVKMITAERRRTVSDFLRKYAMQSLH